MRLAEALEKLVMLNIPSKRVYCVLISESYRNSRIF